jgi:DNA-binding response OmpR family regulator
MDDMNEILSYGDMRVYTGSRRVMIRNSVIRLRNKEYSLLEYFLRNCGKVLTRTRLLEEVWDRNITCPTNTVDVHISSLRRKFKKHFIFAPIKTVHCVGYFFGD